MDTKHDFPTNFAFPSLGVWVDMCFSVKDFNQKEFVCASIEPQYNSFAIPEIMKGWFNLSFNAHSTQYFEEIIYQLNFSALNTHPAPIKFFHRIGNQIWSLHDYSTHNKANHFRFTVINNPFVRKDTNVLPNEGNHYSDDLKGLKILVVDDNQISVLITKKLLETFGVEVASAHNGSCAVDLCNTQTYDLILMDIHMPQLNGFQSARLIRKTHLNQFSAIIAFTTSSFQEVKNELFEAGMNDYIQKPCKAEELHSKICMLVSATRKAV